MTREFDARRGADEAEPYREPPAETTVVNRPVDEAAQSGASVERARARLQVTATRDRTSALIPRWSRRAAVPRSFTPSRRCSTSLSSRPPRWCASPRRERSRRQTADSSRSIRHPSPKPKLDPVEATVYRRAIRRHAGSGRSGREGLVR